VIGSAGTATTSLILVELRALEKTFAAAGISSIAESEVKLTVCKGGPVSGNGHKKAGVSDGDYTSRWIPRT
jgi:hypothetical protein